MVLGIRGVFVGGPGPALCSRSSSPSPCTMSARYNRGIGLPVKVLFVCSRNQWRSPTAETLFGRHPALKVRSAGLSSSARRKLRATDLEWADMICVMEDRHAERLRERFGRAEPPVHVLDIPDIYRRDDPELIEALLDSAEALVTKAVIDATPNDD